MKPQDGSIRSGEPPGESRPVSTLPFHKILDLIANLPTEDQDALMDVVKRRRTELRRAEIADNIRESKLEFAAGRTTRGTVDDLMQEFDR
ncbi:MAG: hypothetical protein V2B18_24790 [Pseudomonadota bacterium]